MSNLLALILVALSVGLENFAASIAIGLSGLSTSLRLKIALTFGFFETAMPIIGLVAGRKVAGSLGGKANIIGGVLLAVMGIFIMARASRKNDEAEVQSATKGFGHLLLAALALSIDNLIVGFGLGSYHSSLVEAAIVIGVVSVVLALAGLELGHRLSSKVEEYSEVLSGIILVLVGLVVGFKII